MKKVESTTTNIAYVRVSTVEQNEGRQVEALKKYDIAKWFIDKASGKNTDRKQLQEMLAYCRKGDVIYISDFSRLARSTKDLLNIMELLQKKGVHLVSIHDNVNTSTAQGKFIVTMLGAIAELERANILERQREGIALAKRQGKYKGRQAVKVKDFTSYYKRYLNREFSKASLAKELGISRPTLYKLIAEQEQADTGDKG